ncbi:MAG: oprF 5 [Crocinitomicaceae bacterium]|jgi:OOP family OmpA-OmpF porin|nr:oprF 5 [Crocinitomicaceae bacterium]
MKSVLTLVLVFALASAYSQAPAYNRFSVDGQFGLNNPVEPMTDSYDAATLNLFHVGLGFRYAVNTKFGLRLGFGYDNFRERAGKPDFSSDYSRVSLEGVANLGNMMDFQTWTRRVGLLLHMGGGYSVLTGASIEPDHIMHGVIGLTPQVRLTERFTMNADASVLANIYQGYTYDLRSSNGTNRGISGYLINVSLGLQYAFGPHAQHADWAILPDKDAEIQVLKERLEKMEQQQRDDDGDGVVNWLDEEPGSAAGATVDTKGRTVAPRDSDSDNIPDDVDNCPFEKGSPAMKGCPDRTGTSTNNSSNSASVIALIEQSEVKFETDKSDLSPSFKHMIEGVADVMKENPSYKLNVTGHADDRASQEYNMALSQRRADAVRAYLIEQGISGDRITTTAMGETQPKINATTVEARAENRRVQFDIR